VLLKLLQHLLIWLAASAAIVLGASWGYAAGFTSHRAVSQVLAWTIASAAVIFAGALVQRAPLAITILVALCAAAFPFAVWLAAAGAPGTGAVYMIVSAIYIASLGRSCWQWLRSHTG
jgi:hypothetical protein